jgi:UDP-GlcNAc:undecaprenyl-phosphate GlcNAc-1-phosphate transferase
MSITAAQFAILGIAAFALTGLLTWPVRALAIRLGAMDAPNMARKTQAEPVPYLGGVALALGVTIVTFGALFFSDEKSLIIERGLTAIIPALLLGLVGLIDDLRSLPAWPRLVIQTIIGTAIAFVLVQSGTLGIAFESDVVNTLTTVFWIVGICNSINFFDNIDGAASGAIAVAALGVFFIAFDRGQVLLSALTIVTAGATIGFLMWNKSPAKIYMGDAGALFLGVIISVATIRLNPGITPQWQSLAIPILLLAVPLLDTCVAVFSRIARGLSPLTSRSGCFTLVSIRCLRGNGRPCVSTPWFFRNLVNQRIWDALASGISALSAHPIAGLSRGLFPIRLRPHQVITLKSRKSIVQWGL